MEPRSHEPHRQMHEPAAPADDRRRSTEESRERSVEDENTPGAVHTRQNSGTRPPSEVREEEREHGA
ncbi:MAG TPA: hypothetical protein VHG51_09150 [Longimicrobiaceae bacterium]|nr:hypothetical protein [Longimicrobiaceae bacterium]